MAGFNTLPQPIDPGDLATQPLSMSEFTEALGNISRRLDQTETADNPGMVQAKEALGYISTVVGRGAETPAAVLDTVAAAVVETAPAVAKELTTRGQSAADYFKTPLPAAHSFSAMHVLGISLKALSATERLVGDPTSARALNAWNKPGLDEFVQSVASAPNFMPDNARLERLQQHTQ